MPAAANTASYSMTLIQQPDKEKILILKAKSHSFLTTNISYSHIYSQKFFYSQTNKHCVKSVRIRSFSGPYNLRGTSQFLVDPIHSAFNGSGSATYLGSKIWEEIPTDIKNKDSLIEFKKEIKKWKPLNCPGRICKTFIPNLGFI